MKLQITGMTCSHCQTSVRRALLSCAGVTGADVDLATGVATVEGDGADPAALLRGVEELGYGATIVKNKEMIP